MQDIFLFMPMTSLIFAVTSANGRTTRAGSTMARNGSKLMFRGVSYFADLKQPELVTVRYYQIYNSSNYKWRGWKEQLWREGKDSWEIVYEGNG